MTSLFPVYRVVSNIQSLQIAEKAKMPSLRERQEINSIREERHLQGFNESIPIRVMYCGGIEWIYRRIARSSAQQADQRIGQGRTCS
jgi:hypothetical protein